MRNLPGLQTKAMRLTPAFAAIFSLVGLLPAVAQVRRPVPHPRPARIELATGWRIQSSAKVPQGGDRISTPGFDAGTWYPATVPSTVISALVDDKLYPDPYYGENLRSMPGNTYDFGDNFAVDPMPPDSPYAVSWWYRTQFNLPRKFPGTRLDRKSVV